MAVSARWDQAAPGNWPGLLLLLWTVLTLKSVIARGNMIMVMMVMKLMLVMIKADIF